MDDRKLKRFMALVDRVTDSGCWIWTGRLDTAWGLPQEEARSRGMGYGYYGGQYAHRLAYEHFRGPIPTGYVVDHLCGNKLCVNPNHLDAVSRAENTRRWSKARNHSQ